MFKNFIDNIYTFDDFYKICSNMSNKEKGDLFEEFTKYIFMFHPFYKNLTKNIWLLDELPDNYKKY